MTKIRILFLCFMCLAGAVACQTGRCPTTIHSKDKIDALSADDSKVFKVRVAKANGSLQCGMGIEVTPQKMAEELKDLKVYSSEKKTDGMMRAQVCGSPTGWYNIYEINSLEIEKAKKLGFKIWMDPESN